MGELAAIGLVLSIHVAGDASRPSRLRAAAAAGAVPLGMGLYLSFSRGALFAFAAGLIALVTIARTREQLRAAVLGLAVAALAALASAPFKGVSALSGASSTRELQGALVLALLAVIVLGAGSRSSCWRGAGILASCGYQGARR